MPKYTHLKKIYLPLTGYKTERTVSVANDGRKVFGGIGNEGLDVGLWIQEKIDDGTIITGGVDLSALIALTGMPAGSSDLDTFTGSIISDNTTIKDALQELETYIESSIAYTDEQSQDAIGSILTDSATIDFTYNDGVPSITASVINNSITFAKIQQVSTQTLLGRSTAGTGNVEQITLGANLQLVGGVLDTSFTPTNGTVTSVALNLPSFITVSGSPVTTTGTLTGTLATQTANTIFAGPTTGAAAQPTFRSLVAADIPTLLSTKISDFNEAVDDQVNALLVAGDNITLTYDDVLGTLTIDASDSSYTNEEAQDAIGTILTNTDTITFIYTDGTPSIEANVDTQMSITSDASGLKLLGDESSPGNSQYYGTDSSGVKGFHSIGSASLPAGTSTQTLRYDGTNTLIANSNLLNDGTYVAIGGSIVSGIRLFVNGAVRNAGVFYSRGSGSFGASTSSSELRLENTTASQTWYIHSSNSGEMQFGSNPINPELIIDTNSDVLVENRLQLNTVTGTATSVIGLDASGYVTGLTLGSGLILSSGTLSATGGGGAGYDTIANNGTSLTPYSVLNFIGEGLIAADNVGDSTTDVSLHALLESIADISGLANGDFIYYNSSSFQKITPVKNTQAVSSGTVVTLPSTPAANTIVDVYRNGVLKEETDDYTLSGTTLTFTAAFTSGEKVTTKYYT